ncbi:hypothetical protein Tco_0709682 [Tanacetum coccineum]
MEISIADQIALDDALVAPADRLKIGKCNLRLSSDVTSKEATLQVVYDVLKLTPFYKAFQVTADAPEIYMQEFWASAYVHNRSFEEPPLEKEILAFLASLGHSGEIRKITDVNVNKLHQPWRSFAAIINKCLSGKPSYDSLRLSQAQILLGGVHKRRNEDTQLYGAILPTELTNEDIRISESYKEYHAIASGKIPPKTKGSKKKADTDTTTKLKPPTVPKEKKEKTSGKGKQKAKELETIPEAIMTEAEQLKIITKRSRKETIAFCSGGGGGKPMIKMMRKAHDNETESEDDGDDFIHPKLTTHDDEIIHEEETDEDDTFDPIVHTPSRISSSDDEDSDNEVEGMDVEGAKSDEDATYAEGSKGINRRRRYHYHFLRKSDSSSVSSGFVSNMLNPNQDTGVDDIFEQHAEATSLIDTPVTAIVEPSFSAQTNRPPTPNPLVIQIQQPPILTPATTTSSSLQNLPNFASLFGFDYRLKALEDNFSELRQTNQYAEALSSIPGIVDHYLANKMQEAVDVAVQLKYDRIREESNTENQQFLDSIDEGMKKVIKEQVKKEVSKITPKIEKLVIEQLESDLWSDIQRQLYKALVDAFESMTNSVDTYGDTCSREKTTTTAGKTTTNRSLKQVSMMNKREEVQHSSCLRFQQPTRLPSPDHAWNKFVPAVHESVQPWLSNLARRQASRKSTKPQQKIGLDQPPKAANISCLRQPLPLVPKSQGRHVIPFHHFIINDLEFLLHLDWITVRRDDDILYKFKEGDFHRTKDQDIKDMLLLLVQGKVTNLNVEERIAFNVSLRMFTRSVVIQRRVEDLQLGVESYQKKLNSQMPDNFTDPI